MYKVEGIAEPARDEAAHIHGHSLSMTLWTSESSELPPLSGRTFQTFTSIPVPETEGWPPQRKEKLCLLLAV